MAVSVATSSAAAAAAAFVLVSSFFLSFPVVALADEYGVETEAPTLFTGETVMICKKRGPLGACLETVPRTAENDNDKATKYFREPIVRSSGVSSSSSEQAGGTNDDENSVNSNALIERLKRQTEENREVNELAVRTKTMLNDQSASFGPFDRSVVVLNTDGKTFTLLENPQAMRLKQAGFIEDRRFVKQPSEEELQQALERPNGDGFLGGIVKGLFGGGGGNDD